MKRCGNDLTRANVMKQAAYLDLSLPMLLPGVKPGIKIETSPADVYPIKQMQLARCGGKSWVRFGDVIAMSQ